MRPGGRHPQPSSPSLVALLASRTSRAARRRRPQRAIAFGIERPVAAHAHGHGQRRQPAPLPRAARRASSARSRSPACQQGVLAPRHRLPARHGRPLLARQRPGRLPRQPRDGDRGRGGPRVRGSAGRAHGVRARVRLQPDRRQDPRHERRGRQHPPQPRRGQPALHDTKLTPAGVTVVGSAYTNSSFAATNADRNEAVRTTTLAPDRTALAAEPGERGHAHEPGLDSTSISAATSASTSPARGTVGYVAGTRSGRAAVHGSTHST